MGDRARVQWAEKWGIAVPLSVVEGWVPSNNVPWAEAYVCAKWHLDASNRLATIHQRYRETGRTTVP